MRVRTDKLTTERIERTKRMTKTNQKNKKQKNQKILKYQKFVQKNKLTKSKQNGTETKINQD